MDVDLAWTKQSTYLGPLKIIFVGVQQGYGIGGSNATCISIGPQAGGLTLACRGCSQSGYQPFKGASALQFWIRDQNGSSTIPDVQVRRWFCAI